MTRPLLIGPKEKAAIAVLKEKAVSYPFTRDKMIAREKEQLPTPGDMGFFVDIPIGYRVCFTIEQHKINWYKSLSVSVPGSKMPHPAAVNMIIEEFGFDGTIQNLPDGVVMKDPGGDAILVMQQLDNATIKQLKKAGVYKCQ